MKKFMKNNEKKKVSYSSRDVSSGNAVYSISKNGILMLKGLERFSPKPCKRSKRDMFRIIGYGHKLPENKKIVFVNGILRSKLNERSATSLLIRDLKKLYMPKLNAFLMENNIRLTQNQYDACIIHSFARGADIWEKRSAGIAVLLLSDKAFEDCHRMELAFMDGACDMAIEERRCKEGILFSSGIYTY